jgi:hypothetical protein
MKKVININTVNPIFIISRCLILVGLLLISCVDDDPVEFGIKNEPPAAIGFEIDQIEAVEGSQTATFEINASKPLFNDISFDLSVVSGNDGEITLTDDNGNTGPNFVMKAGTDKLVLSVMVANNNIFSGNRDIVYELQNLIGDSVFLVEESVGSGDDKINPQSTLTVIEDEPVPLSVNFSEVTASINENAGSSYQVLMQLTEPAIASGSFDIQFSGTAIEGTDYTSSLPPASATININVTDTQFTFDITPIDDLEVKGDRTVILTITNPSNGFQIGTNNVHTLTIVEDDLPIFTLNPEADCGIRGGDRGDNPAAGGEIVRAANGTDARGRDERQMMFRFDLNGIDLNNVISATLKLTTVGVDSGGSDRSWTEAEEFNANGVFGDGISAETTQKIYHVTGADNWDETTVTWNSAPAFTPTPIATGAFGIVGGSVETHEYDVKDTLVLDTDGKFSIRVGIDNDTDGKSVFYQTRESTLGGVPELVIVLSN